MSSKNKKNKSKKAPKKRATRDAAAEKEEAVANKPPTTSHHNAGGFRAKLDRKLTKLDRTFDLIPVPKPRTPPPPLDAYERDGCELIGETVFFYGPRPAVRKRRVSAAEWEAALPLVGSIGTAIAASAGDFGGYTIPIIGLGLLAAIIALLAGPVED